MFGRSTSVEPYGPIGVGVISVGVGVAEGVGVGVEEDESNVFKSGLYNPTVTPSFVNVVLLKKE
ncbi:MAG TPA: hypothetical protein VIS72_15120 [Anaerolineales bacterium]